MDEQTLWLSASVGTDDFGDSFSSDDVGLATLGEPCVAAVAWKSFGI